MESQKYGPFKPLKKISDAKDQKEKKKLLLQWFRYAGKCTIRQNRANKCGVLLFDISRQKKKNYIEKIKVLFAKEMSAKKLTENEAIQLRWLYSALSLKDLTVIAKKAGFRHFNQKNVSLNISLFYTDNPLENKEKLKKFKRG